jgi:hypothetical protein
MEHITVASSFLVCGNPALPHPASGPTSALHRAREQILEQGNWRVLIERPRAWHTVAQMTSELDFPPVYQIQRPLGNGFTQLTSGLYKSSTGRQ